MYRGKKLKQMHRFINKYGVIDKEYDRPPDKTFPLKDLAIKALIIIIQKDES